MGRGCIRFRDTYITDLPKFKTKCRSCGCNKALYSFCLVSYIFLPVEPRCACGSVGVLLCFAPLDFYLIPCKRLVHNKYSRDALKNFEKILLLP
jgi:hypothetical protein